MSVRPWDLRNIHQALYHDADGNVALRTGFVGNIVIAGDVNVPGSVDAHISEIGTSGNLTVPWMPVSLDGNANVRVTSLPNVNAAVTGTVSVSSITSNVNVNPITGNVSVTQGTSPWAISGNVTTVGNLTNDGKPWQLQVAQGQIAGVTGLSIAGYGNAIGTSYVPAWELNTVYTYFPSAQVVRVWSSSASDINVSVLINGLDANYIQQSETVVLTNGTTGILSTKQFLRINSIAVAGSVQNVGSIRIGSSDKTITSAYMGNATNITAGRSQMSVYTVPAGYTFYLTQSNWYTNQVGSQTALYRSWTQTPTGIVSIVLTFPMQQQYNSTKVVPRPYPEKTDIQWQVASSTGTSEIGGQVEGYLIANTL
jgi:hypothetical protein